MKSIILTNTGNNREATAVEVEDTHAQDSFRGIVGSEKEREPKKGTETTFDIKE